MNKKMEEYDSMDKKSDLKERFLCIFPRASTFPFIHMVHVYCICTWWTL